MLFPRVTSIFPSLILAGTVAAYAEDKVTYVDHVLPIFRNACNNCHNPDKKKAGLDLTTYGATMAGSENGAVVKAGQPDGSLLFKVCAQTEEPKMPPKGDKLTEAEMTILKNWIAGYALETATSKPAAAQNQVSLAVVSLERPPGPPPMPGDLPLEPYVRPKASNPVTAMAVSPWAPLVAIGGQKQVTLYNTETLQPVGVLPFPEGFPQIIRFSRNGQILLVGGGLGGKSGKVTLWNVVTGQRVGNVGDETDQVLAADLSPDHGFVALGGPTKVLKIYSTKDGKLLHSLKKHTDWVTAVSFSPDGKFLASADRNGGLMVWEGASGNEYNPLPGHKQMVTALAFMPGILASASTDGKIALWDVNEAKEIRTWTAHGNGVEWIDFTPDGRLASCGRDRVAKVWDSTGKQLGTSPAFNDIALRAGMVNDRLVAADWSGQVRVIGLQGQILGELTANPAPIAEQLSVAARRLDEAKAAVPPAEQALAAAEQKLVAQREAAETKRKADLATAHKSLAEAKAAIEASKTQVASLEKRVRDLQAESQALEPSLAAARKESEASQKALAERKAANDTDLAAAEAATARAAKAVVELTEKQAALTTSVKTAQAELTKAAAAQPATLAAHEKAAAAAQERVALTIKPGPIPAIDEAEIAALSRKVADTTADLLKRRDGRAKLKPGTPEYKQADDAIQGVKATLAKLEEQLAAAKKPHITPFPAEAEVAAAKATLEKARATLVVATSNAEHWRRAAAFMSVHRAENSYGEMKAAYDALLATAKDAYRMVDQVRSQIAALEKSVAAAPAELAKAEAAAAEMARQLDVADKATAAALKAVKARETGANADPKTLEARVAAAQKKVDGLKTEITKRQETLAQATEGTPEREKAAAALNAAESESAAADKALAEAKSELASLPGRKAELTAAQEALKKAQDLENSAHERSMAAQKALAKLKQTAQAETKQLAELRGREPKLAQDAAATKTKAEGEASGIAKQLEQSKAEATRVRADFEAKWRPNRQASVN